MNSLGDSMEKYKKLKLRLKKMKMPSASMKMDFDADKAMKARVPVGSKIKKAKGAPLSTKGMRMSDSDGDMDNSPKKEGRLIIRKAKGPSEENVMDKKGIRREMEKRTNRMMNLMIKKKRLKNEKKLGKMIKGF